MSILQSVTLCKQCKWTHFFLRVLLTILLTETVVMFLLPLILPADVSGWIEALADALILTIICSPLLWLFVFRPLRQLAIMEKEKADAIINTAADPIITISSDGLIKSYNSAAERLFGYSESEVIDENVKILIPSPHREQHDAYLACYLKTGKKNVIGIGREVMGQKKDGSIFPMHLSVGEVVHGNYGVRFTGIIRDLTAQKQAEADLEDSRKQAEAANESKSEFLANMSHEIRTPMTAILGYTDILLGNVNKPENIEAARIVKENGGFLINLINDILDLSKIESGKLEIEKIECSPHDIIANVTTLMSVRASEKDLQLNVRFEGGIPETIHSDPTRLRQVLINLIGNAIKFTETGSVQIVTRLLNELSEDPVLQFDIIDTGIGITEDKIEKLFQPFTQADNSTTRKYGGTGLGLSISQRLVEFLGGNISITSLPGKGSTFSVTISTGPLAGVKLLHNKAEQCNEKSVEKPVDEPPVSLEGRRILLAEDQAINQRLIGYLLNKAGAEVTFADNGQIAFDLATTAQTGSDPFDVVLMDMQMPVLDGYAATRKLRNEGYAGTVIALTAHAMTGDCQKCLDAGCSDYITKPIDKKTLVSKIAQYVSPGTLDSATVLE